jgi:hypothetical protein
MSRFFPSLPHTCNESYARRWPTGVPYTHDQLQHHRRGQYWKQIIAIPECLEETNADGESVSISDTGTATVRYQFAEYQNGHGVGLRGDCQDAEWYIGWLVNHPRGLNLPNGWLTGYIHGKHLRQHGIECDAECETRIKNYEEPKPAPQPRIMPKRIAKPTGGKTKMHSLRSFADVTPSYRPASKHTSFESIIIEALIEELASV